MRRLGCVGLAMFRRPAPGQAAQPAVAASGAGALGPLSAQDASLTSALLSAVAAQAQASPSSSSTLPAAPARPNGTVNGTRTSATNGTHTNGINNTSTTSGSPSTLTLAAPIQICTSVQSLNSLLSTHTCLTVMFTSQTCAPCKAIEPVFERIAEQRASEHVGFAKVDMGMMGGQMIAGGYEVRATPSFLFFLKGKKVRLVFV